MVDLKGAVTAQIIKEAINNTANTKEGTDGQTRRLKRITIVVFVNLLT